MVNFYNLKDGDLLRGLPIQRPDGTFVNFINRKSLYLPSRKGHWMSYVLLYVDFSEELFDYIIKNKIRYSNGYYYSVIVNGKVYFIRVGCTIHKILLNYDFSYGSSDYLHVVANNIRVNNFSGIKRWID